MAASLPVTTVDLAEFYMAAKAGAAAFEGFDATLLQGLVDQVSALFESSLHRRLLEEVRVEQFNVRRNQKLLAVDAFPILAPVDPTPLLELREASNRVFTNSSTIILATDYYADLNRGTLLLDGAFHGGAGSVRLAWTGGMGTNQADLGTRYPDLVEAANLWIAELWDRRDTHTRRERGARNSREAFIGLGSPPDYVEAVLAQYRASRLTRI